MNQPLIDAKTSEQHTAGLRFDIVAGLTAAAVVLPKAMAYATVAGLPVAVGLYTALMEAETRATARGAIVWLVGLNPGVLEVVRKSGLAERLGPERMLFNARAAIERYQALQATANASQYQT